MTDMFSKNTQVSNFMTDRFSKNTQISKVMKIHPVEADLFHADMTKLTVTFRNFPNGLKDDTFIATS
jgi:hypothetical protein